MRDGWASYSDPAESPYASEAHRWQRYGREPPLVSGNVILVVVACFVLLGFISADVGALTSLPVKVTVTQVNWAVANLSLGNSSGFGVLAGHEFTVRLECEIFCVKFVGASVASPFVLVADSISFPWFEYVNVTLRAPSSAYQGPVNIALSVGPPTGAHSVGGRISN